MWMVYDGDLKICCIIYIIFIWKKCKYYVFVLKKMVFVILVWIKKFKKILCFNIFWLKGYFLVKKMI